MILNPKARTCILKTDILGTIKNAHLLICEITVKPKCCLSTLRQFGKKEVPFSVKSSKF